MKMRVKPLVFCIALVLLFNTNLSGQNVFLVEGDTYVYSFTNLPLWFPQPGPGSYQPRVGGTQIYAAPLAPNQPTLLRMEMFEGQTNGSPICTVFITESNPAPVLVGCSVDEAWGDLEGSVRLTMVRGSIQIYHFFLRCYRGVGGSYEGRGIYPVLPPAPSLAAKQVQGGLELSWGTNQLGYTLEKSSNGSFTNWSTVTNAVGVNGYRFRVTNDMNSARSVFRLRK
jgi:hypothetical protein